MHRPVRDDELVLAVDGAARRADDAGEPLAELREPARVRCGRGGAEGTRDRVDDVGRERRRRRPVQRHDVAAGLPHRPKPLVGVVGREPVGHEAQAGTTGRSTCDGYAGVWRTVWWATCIRVPVPTSSPVLRFRENRGKLELVRSSRIRCPRRKTFATG